MKTLIKRFWLLLVCGAVAGVSVMAVAENQVSTLRGQADLDKNEAAPSVAKVINTDIRQSRNYPEQPPLIPHKIDGYQIHSNVNKCLDCHAREATEVSQAPMASVTHFMDRDGQVLAEVSPRRYFCTQCHVTQHDSRPLVGNTFQDSSAVISTLRQEKR